MAAFRSNASDSNKIALKTARSAVKTAVKEAKLRWVSVRIGEIERYKFDPREAWRAVRELNEMFMGMRKLGTQIITDQKARIYAPQLPSSNRWV